MIKNEPIIRNCKLYHGDCMELMAEYDDKYFDLAIVDPPYGSKNHCWAAKFGKDILQWDKAPPPEYFRELFRVSKHQIIFGGNYFALPPSPNFIVWHKSNIPENFTMASVEYAWLSMPGNSRIFKHQSSNIIGRFHPTQKPVALYKWLLQNYAKAGYKILDTHFGSGSLGVACLEFPVSLTAIEINDEYFKKSVDRLKKESLNSLLFEPHEIFSQGEQCLDF